MQKFVLTFFLMLFIVGPAIAYQGEKPVRGAEGMHFFIDPVAGPEEASFEIVLRNDGDAPLAFTFPTSQSYEITVQDPGGREVYRYSAGKAFAQALRTVTILPGKSVTWQEKWDLRHEGARVKEGEYQVSAVLKASLVNDNLLPPLTDVKTMYVPGESTAFRKVKVSGTQGIYSIEGKASPKLGHFYYSVEDGHNQLISETKVESDQESQGWRAFSVKIAIPKESLPKNGTLILTLYERTSEGEFTNTYPVLLEKFY